KFLAGLRQLHQQVKLHLPERLQATASFMAWLRPLYAKDWVVYAKPPFDGGPEQVLKYLARYTHRVAISNHRLLKLEEGRVTFRYKDYADAHQEKLLTLPAEEFLRRFVQHVLPRGFMKIRHYGLLSSRHRQTRLHAARQLLLPLVLLQAVATTTVAPAEPPHCPQCGSVRRQRAELVSCLASHPFASPVVETSLSGSIGDTS